jgi:hypothetical protein
VEAEEEEEVREKRRSSSSSGVLHLLATKCDGCACCLAHK